MECLWNFGNTFLCIRNIERDTFDSNKYNYIRYFVMHPLKLLFENLSHICMVMLGHSETHYTKTWLEVQRPGNIQCRILLIQYVSYMIIIQYPHYVAVFYMIFLWLWCIMVLFCRPLSTLLKKTHTVFYNMQTEILLRDDNKKVIY